MAVYSDIKDAGVLASFERWGWPWHGLCQGGSIGSSGMTIEQPLGGHSWLIDKGLPALDLTPEKILSEAAEGREWRNYGLISGGQVNGTWLPRRQAGGYYEANSYIHVDDAGINWMVTLVFNYPAVNTLRVIASIVQFGHFEVGVGAQTPITKTVDVACTEISGTYFSRDTSIHDVWTNGDKALVCVWWDVSGTDDWRMVVSAVEVTLTGSGGTTGSGLVMAASEVKAKSSLSVQYNIPGTLPAIASGVMGGSVYFSPTTGAPQYLLVDTSVEITWDQTTGFGGGYPAVVGHDEGWFYCRFCAYDSSGNVVAYRLKVFTSKTHEPYSAEYPTIYNSPNIADSGGVLCAARAEWSMTIKRTSRAGWELLQNDTVIDSMVREKTMLITELFIAGCQLPGPTYCGVALTCSDFRNTYSTEGTETGVWHGSLSGDLGSLLDWKYSGVYPLYDVRAGWLAPGQSGDAFVYLDDDTTRVGVRQTLNSAAFFTGAPTARIYGTVATQLGNKTTALTGDFYFAWQRKTDDFAFSSSPICYV